MPFDCPTVEARRRQVAKRLNSESQPNRSLRIPSERWRFSIRGRVQGVGYRAACCRRAQELGLAGWVRNCSDGSVEVQAEGNEHRLTELRVWCECGPPEPELIQSTAAALPPPGPTGLKSGLITSKATR